MYSQTLSLFLVFAFFAIILSQSSKCNLVCPSSVSCRGTPSFGCGCGFGQVNCTKSTNVCSGRGICSITTTSSCTSCKACSAKCLCDVGYVGTACQLPTCNGLNSTNPLVCSGKGSCTSYNTCNCSTNYVGSFCQFPICFGLNSTNTNVCSGHGSCNSPNNCTCNAGWTGPQCQFAICNGKNSTNPTVCSSKGSCNSPNNCTCQNGYSGNDCQFTSCFGLNSTNPQVCSGNGTCTSPDVCSCKTSYTGNQCQFGDACFGKNSTDPQVCSGNGNCTGGDNCVCTSNWSGPNCQYPKCFGIGSNETQVCSKNGVCSSPNNCTCNAGYTGDRCQYPICFGKNSTDSTVCSSSGNCTSANNCTCFYSGFFGDNCQFAEFHFKNTSGYWSNATSWFVLGNGLQTATRVPGNGDKVFIDLPGNYTLTIDQTVTMSQISFGCTSSCFITVFAENNINIQGSVYVYPDVNINVVRGGTLNFNGPAQILSTLVTYGESTVNFFASSQIAALNYDSDVFNFYSDVKFTGDSIINTNNFVFSKSVTLEGNSVLVFNFDSTFTRDLYVNQNSSLILNGNVDFTNINITSNAPFTGQGSMTIKGVLDYNVNGLTAQLPSVAINNAGTAYFNNGNYILSSFNARPNSKTFISTSLQVTDSSIIESNIEGSGSINYKGNVSFIGNVDVLPKITSNSLITLSSNTTVNLLNTISFDNNFTLIIPTSSSLNVLSGSMTLSNKQIYGSGTLSFLKGGRVLLNSSQTTIDVVVKSNGTLDLFGQFSFDRAVEFSQDSSLNISTSTSLLFNNQFTWSLTKDVYGGGSIQIGPEGKSMWYASSVNMDISLTSFGNTSFFGSFALTNSATFKENSSLSINSGSLTFKKDVVINSNNFFEGSGTVVFEDSPLLSASSVTISSNQFAFNGPVTLKTLMNVNTGLVTFNSILLLSGSGKLNIPKPVIVSLKGASTFSVSDAVIGTGTLKVESGSLTWGNGGSISVSLEFSSDVTFTNGRFTINSLLSVLGNSKIGLQSSTVSVNSNITFNTNGGFIGNGLFIQEKSSFLTWSSGNLNDIQLILNGNTLFNDLDKTFINGNITIFGETTLLSKINLRSTNITSFSSKFTHNSGSFIGTGNTLISNYGNYLSQTTIGTSASLLAKFMNYGTLNVSGDGAIFISPLFDQAPQSIFTINNTNVFCSGTLYINNGNFLVGGIVRSSLNITTNTGIVFLLSSLRVFGNFHFDKRSTMFVDVLGANSPFVYPIFVEGGYAKVEGFVTIRLRNGYDPNVGDNIYFISLSKDYQMNNTVTSNINMIGASYRNAKITVTNNDVKITIITSLGSLDQDITCHFLGKSKTVEYRIFNESSLVSISFTLPPNVVNRTIVLGLMNNSINDAPVIVSATNGEIKRINGQLFDSSVSSLQSLFSVGPKYLTVNFLVDVKYLSSQYRIFYGETVNSSLIYNEIFEYRLLDKKNIDCTNVDIPMRAETYTYYTLGLVLIIYIVSFIGCLILIRLQPMNSRKFASLITLVFLFLQLALEIKNYFSLTEVQQSLCLYYGYGYLPFTQMTFLVIFCYILYNLAFIHLNYKKNDIILGKSSEKNIQIMFLRFITRLWILLVFLLLSFLTMYVVYSIILVIDLYVCRFRTFITLKLINSIFIIIVNGLSLGLVVLDLIFSWKTLIQCHWINYVFYKDPYFIRVQIFMFVPFLIYSICAHLYILSNSFLFKDIVQTFSTQIVLNTITYTWIYLVEVLFPLVCTFIVFLFRYFKRPAKKDPIVQTLNNPKLYKLFQQFCINEFNAENIICWREIQNYKSAEDRKKQAIYVFQKFLRGPHSYLMEIYASYEIVEEIKIKIQDMMLKDDLFLALELHLEKNLEPTYDRFLYSDVYVLYKDGLEADSELKPLINVKEEKPYDQNETAQVVIVNKGEETNEAQPSTKSVNNDLGI